MKLIDRSFFWYSGREPFVSRYEERAHIVLRSEKGIHRGYCGEIAVMSSMQGKKNKINLGSFRNVYCSGVSFCEECVKRSRNEDN